MRLSIKKRLALAVAFGLLSPIVGVLIMSSSIGSSELLLRDNHALVEIGSAVERLVFALNARMVGEVPISQEKFAETVAAFETSVKGHRLEEEGADLVRKVNRVWPLSLGEAEHFTSFVATTNDIAAFQTKVSDHYRAGYALLWENRDKAVYGSSLLLLASLAAIGTLGWLISRSITKPLDELTLAARAMAQGDLRVHIPTYNDTELKDLAEGFRQLRHKLQETLLGLRAHARQVSAAAASVAAATAQMTEGAQEQSAASEETSSAMEEIAVQIQGVSRNAVDLAGDSGSVLSAAQEIGKTADQLRNAATDLDGAVGEAGTQVEVVSTRAKASAKNLEEVASFSRQIDKEAQNASANLQASIARVQEVGETSRASSQAFEALGERSRQITGIVQTMGEIADQTNLLALNAAIEAARAGESGRGFAVVADEVRRLAERAIGAAREVEELIGSIQEQTRDAISLARNNATKTDEGTRLITEAGAAMQRVVDSILRVGGLVNDVFEAVSEQSSTSAELRTKVEEIRKLSGFLMKSATLQATSAGAAIEAVERISHRTRQVADATVQVRAGGEQVLKAIENISLVARQNQETIHRVSDTMGRITGKASDLQSHLENLRIAEEAT